MGHRSILVKLGVEMSDMAVKCVVYSRKDSDSDLRDVGKHDASRRKFLFCLVKAPGRASYRRVDGIAYTIKAE